MPDTFGWLTPRGEFVRFNDTDRCENCERHVAAAVSEALAAHQAENAQLREALEAVGEVWEQPRSRWDRGMQQYYVECPHCGASTYSDASGDAPEHLDACPAVKVWNALASQPAEP